MIAAFLIGIPDSFAATKELVSWVSPLGFQPIHVAFSLLGVGAIYTTIIQGIRHRKLEDSLPDIVVQPETRNDRAVLSVTNNGGHAIFTAKARVIATQPEAELYTMYWESVPGVRCSIDGEGGIATILVAEKAKHDNKTKEAETFFMKGDLILFKMGTSLEQVFPVYAGQRREYVENGAIVRKGWAIPRCIVQVTITATPRLRRRWETHKYLCEIENGRLRFHETEISSPHKTDSQS